MNAIDAPEYAPSWYAAALGTADEPRALSADLDADICIVGGGLAGLTVACELARRDWSVVVLEAGLVGSDWSGQGAGIVSPGFPERPERIAERVGLDTAKELWRLSLAGVDHVRTALGEGARMGVGPAGGHLAVQSDDDADRCRRQVDLLNAFETEAEMWPTERVRAVLRSPMHHQAVHLPAAFHIDPLAYVLALAAQARGAGARIYERTPALAIDPEGVRKRVHTPTGRVRARHIVLTASEDAGRLYPPLAGTVIPLARALGVTAPLGGKLATAVRFAGAVTSPDAAGGSHRIAGGDRLLWAGPLTTGPSSRRGLAAPVRRHLVRTYPQLREATVEHAWSVRADYAVHRMPQIGELSPGLWRAGAFGHQGIAAAAMAGDLIARAIHGGDDRWRLFQPFGLVWAGGRTGRAATAIALRLIGARARMRLLFAPRLDPLPDDAVPAAVIVFEPASPPTQPAAASAAEALRRKAKRSTAETTSAGGNNRRKNLEKAADTKPRELSKPADVLAKTAERALRPRRRKDVAAPALAAQSAPERSPAKGEGIEP